MNTPPLSTHQPWGANLAGPTRSRQGLEQLSSELGEAPAAPASAPEDTVVTTGPTDEVVKPRRSLGSFLKQAIPVAVALGAAVATAAGIASLATPAVVVGAACIAAGGAIGSLAGSSDVNFAPLGGAVLGGVAAAALGCPLVGSLVTLMISGGAGMTAGLLTDGLLSGADGKGR